MSSNGKPSLFIGSSVEGLEVAYALQESLEYDAEPTVWPQGVFTPTASTLADLLEVARKTDFAAFVFTPDDIRVMRLEQGATPRDNVVFELGLMIGARGSDRCVYVMPDDEKLQLPTDLLGLTPLTYVSKRQDANLLAALGPAANRIRRMLQVVGPVSVTEVAKPSAPPADPVDEIVQFIGKWNSGDLLAAREVLRGAVPMHMMEDETGEATAAMRRVFAFLESMADGVIAGRLSEPEARMEFAVPLRAVWERAFTYLAPLNVAEEWWRPPPKIEVLDKRWQGRAS
ncbi:nucleotide-binding protein [Phenylobacterium sp.]|uniref:nucleotide-binding protein n=1 Tax=Phenylobacterium sp. TaxID=1871053 RepID=UPI003982DD90